MEAELDVEPGELSLADAEILAIAERANRLYERYYALNRERVIARVIARRRSS